MRESTSHAIALIRAYSNKGLCLTEIAAQLGKSTSSVSIFCKKYSLALPKGHRKGAADRDRLADVVALYKKGNTLQQIGDLYGVSRERIRQLLRKYTEVAATDGGQVVLSRKLRAERDNKFAVRKGCPKVQWRQLRDMGRSFMADGQSYYSTPLGAFAQQRSNAKRRGIEWRLTIAQWWDIWQRSGHWDERGRGQGFAMCRYGDKGPYSVNNVYIGTNAENIKHYHARLRMEAA